MANDSSLIDKIVFELGSALSSIGGLVETAENQASLLERLGYQPPEPIDIFDDVVASLGDFNTNLDKLRVRFESGSFEDPEAILDTISFIDSFVEVVSQLNNLPSKVQNQLSSYSDYLDNSGIKENLPIRLLNYLIVNHLWESSPKVFSWLELLGIFETRLVLENTYNPDFYLHQIHWERFINILTDPKELFVKGYGWGTPGFNPTLTLKNIEGLIWSSQSQALSAGPDDELGPELSLSSPDDQTALVFQYPIINEFIEVGDGPEDFGSLDIGTYFYLISNNADIGNSGIAIAPYLIGRLNQTFEILSGWNIHLGGDLELDGNIGVSITPNDGLNIFKNQSPSEPLPNGDIEIKIKQDDAEKNKIFSLGGRGATEISINGVSFGFKLHVEEIDPEFSFQLNLDQVLFRISGSNGDGFLQKVLPSNPAQVDFNVSTGYSNKRGFFLSGAAGFEFTFNINREVGPFFIATIDLGLEASGQELEFFAAISGGAAIGPVAASISKIGLKLKIEFNKSGNLGNSDLSVDFKPPSGMGLALDGGGFKGGGLLEIDKPNYSGLLNVSFEQTFDLTIVGLITTEFPDGRNGFSMVLSIMAKFQPIQLGFGFALTGIGGLIGIHRSMSEDALRQVFKDRSLDALLFPENPIADGLRIIDAIRNIFPVNEGRYTFGLMGEIIWGGAVPLVLGRIGVIIETPGPVEIAIIGQGKIALPDPLAPAIEINMDFMGYLDFGNETFALDSQIYDSRILQYSFQGDMAMRSSWGEQPGFVFSVGGFFPQYNPPPGLEFPQMRKISLRAGTSSAYIQFSLYFAITTNTVQLGASLELYAKLGPVEVDGKAGFDALIKFNPFSFNVQIYAWAKIKFKGAKIASIDLRINLTGPNPFHAVGYAKISLLLFSVKVNLDKTFGFKKKDELPVVSPFDTLFEQLQDFRNIHTELPTWTTSFIKFKESEDSRKLLDPLGTLVFEQKAVPINLFLEKFAETKPPENERYLTFGLAIESESQTEELPANCPFVPSQFRDWSDTEKLAAPAFENFNCGKRWRSSFKTKPRFRADIGNFETIVREPIALEEEGVEPFTKLNRFIKGSEGLRRTWGLQGGKEFYRTGRKPKNHNHKKFVHVGEPLFTVATSNAKDGALKRGVKNGAPAKDLTYTEAKDWQKTSGVDDTLVINAAFSEPVSEEA